MPTPICDYDSGNPNLIPQHSDHPPQFRTPENSNRSLTLPSTYPYPPSEVTPDSDTSPSTTTTTNHHPRSPTGFRQPNDAVTVTVPLLLHSNSKSFIFDELRNFRISLKWWALDQSSISGKILSIVAFFIFTILFPVASAIFVKVSSTANAFKMLVQVPESGLAIIAFLTLSCFFRRYGLRQLLFLDQLGDDLPEVREGYTRALDKAFKYLACILLPSFSVELAHKIIWFSTVTVTVPFVHARLPANSVMFIVGLASWVYRTGVFLLVCVLFRLTCELQILRFEGFKKFLEGCGSDTGVIFREHARIRHQLSVTSHRFRLFILGCTVTVTVSQLAALLLVLATKAQKNFFNSGDLVVCSAVQLSGFFLCLVSAVRITHRAQGVVSIATRWHMITTCASTTRSDVLTGKTPTTATGTDENNYTSDSESSEVFIVYPSKDASAFETRQALVSYLQHNNGGITLFGFALDRGLLHTLFAFEFSLVLWILSKVIVIH